MDESLTQQRRVRDEAPWSVNRCQKGRTVPALIIRELTVPSEEAPANSVPAAAVIRGEQALFGITGRKGCAGGRLGRM
jgi:hypothetical protein